MKQDLRRLTARCFFAAWLPCAAGAALAGGSNYGIAPGTPDKFTGKVSEWPVPTPEFARDPAPGPDGDIYVSVMAGNKIAHFNTKTQKFNEWNLPSGAHPHGLLVDSEGIVWYTGNGRLIKVDTAAAKIVKEYDLPAGKDGGPYAVTIDGSGMIWVNEINTDTVVRLDPKSDQMRVVNLPSKGVGIRKMIVDARGRLWYMGSHNGRLGVIE